MLSNPFPIGAALGRFTAPSNYTLDLKIERAVQIGKTDLNFYLYVQNALNRKNVQHVYWHTGTTTNDGAHTPILTELLRQFWGQEFFDLYDLVNHVHRQHYQITQGTDLFQTPREIRFGLQLALAP